MIEIVSQVAVYIASRSLGSLSAGSGADCSLRPQRRPRAGVTRHRNGAVLLHGEKPRKTSTRQGVTLALGGPIRRAREGAISTRLAFAS